MLVGYSQTGQNLDFFAFNTDGQVWNGSSFVEWNDVDYVDYRIEATEVGSSGRYTATAPSGTIRYDLRFRDASVSGSYVVWEEKIDQNNVDEVPDQFNIEVRTTRIG